MCRWTKTSDNREVLMESHNIRLKRVTYLEQLKKYEAEGRPIIFTDESYIHSTHSTPKEWSDGNMPGKKKPYSKGKRLILVHAGGKDGFIPNALLMFNSGTKSGDYHDEMNYQNFSKWVKMQLLPNLPPRSVLVIDNASYHNVTLEKHPTSSSLKVDMVTWLAERNIPHDPAKPKPQLYEIIKQHKPEHRKYELDALLHGYGHSVLRLPPYHPELNPIEKIWAIVKNWVASNNANYTLTDVKNLALEKFNAITAQEWSAVCSHVDKIVHNYMEKEHLLDDALDNLRFIVNTGDSEDEESEAEDEVGGKAEDTLSGIDELSDFDDLE